MAQSYSRIYDPLMTVIKKGDDVNHKKQKVCSVPLAGAKVVLF